MSALTYNSTPPTLANGQSAPPQADSGGNLKTAPIVTGALDAAPPITTGWLLDGTATKRALSVALYANQGGGLLGLVGGDANGLVTQPGLSSTYWQSAAAAGGIVSSTADVALKTAAGAGVRNYLSSITINHDTLSAVTECVIKDGSTVIWRGKLQTPATDSALGSGSIKFDPPLRGSANTAMNFALLTSVTGGVFVNAQGFTGA